MEKIIYILKSQYLYVIKVFRYFSLKSNCVSPKFDVVLSEGFLASNELNYYILVLINLF